MWMTTYRNNPIDKFFNDFFETAHVENHHHGVSVFDKDDTLHVRADLPGLNKEEIGLEVKDGYLSISAERKVEKEKNAKIYTWGSSEYNFKRTVKLPYGIEADKVDAKYENGVLTVTLPRAEESKPKSILIN